MILFTIPYEAEEGTWSVRTNGDRVWRYGCDSRTEALRLAAESARTEQKSRGEKAMVSVQGADGEWRHFDYELKGAA